MSNVILGIESLSPVLLVLCYICNKCLLVGERRMEFISLESVFFCVKVTGNKSCERVIGTGSFPSSGIFLARQGREDETTPPVILQGCVLTLLLWVLGLLLKKLLCFRKLRWQRVNPVAGKSTLEQSRGCVHVIEEGFFLTA